MTRRCIQLATVAVILGCSPMVRAQRPPVLFGDPDRVTFGSSSFELPDPSAYAVSLGEGLTAYVAEDHQTATVELTALIGASRLDDPAGKEGLAEALAYAMSVGGPTGLTPANFRGRLERMTARLSAVVDNEHTRVSMSLLNDDLAEGLALFVSILRAPRLDGSVREMYVRRGPIQGWDPDEPRARAEVEFARLMYGDHPAGRRPTPASLQAISDTDLEGFRQRYYVPNNIVLAISGGISRAAVVADLQRGVAGWKRSAMTHAAVPPVPQSPGRTIHAFETSSLQGWLIVGHLGGQGRAADRPALEIANYILGGGGAIWKRVHAEWPPAVPEGHFYARLFNETRSTRGLTNDTSSYVPVGFRLPALIYAVSSGRPESIAPVLSLIDREWRRMAEEFSDSDIEIARQALTEGYFQMRYAGAHQTALTLAEERFFDGSHAWSQAYVAAIRAVTKEQVLAAARKHFRPDDLVAVLVGPLQRIQADQHPLYRHKLEDFGTLAVHPWN